MKVNSAIFNGMKGPLADTVVCNRYGKKFMRSLPASYHDANSLKQQHHRAKMQLAQGFVRKIKGYVKMSYGLTGNLGYNKLLSQVMKEAMKETNGVWMIDYECVKVSDGTKNSVRNGRWEKRGEVYCFMWDAGTDAEADDRVLPLVMNVTRGEMMWYSGDEWMVRRGEGRFEMEVPNYWNEEDEKVAWIGVVNGRSVCLGRG